MESLAHNAGDVLQPGHQVAVLHDGSGHTEHVCLLEGRSTDESAAHLGCNGHHGDGIEHGISNTGNQIGGTRAGGGHAHTHLPRHTPIAFCRKSTTLFVAGQNRTNRGFVTQRLVYGHTGTAGVCEYYIYPLTH